MAQVRTIRDLPPVRGAVLPRLVAAQDRRFFRRNGRPLVTDAAWVGENGTRVARAAAAEEPLLEAIVAGARAAGLAVAALTVAGEPATLSLLPSTERHALDRVARRSVRRLGAVTVGVWAVALGLFAGRLIAERRRIDAELAAAREPAAAVRAARRELAEAEATIEAMRTAERDRGRALATLGAIARALPDSVVLTSLVWTADESGVLGAVGRRAGEAVAALQRARAVSDPRPDGRVVRETVLGREWERFTIIYGRRDGGRGTGDGP
jgi:Tfp pilus assembly protein PilN